MKQIVETILKENGLHVTLIRKRYWSYF